MRNAQTQAVIDAIRNSAEMQSSPVASVEGRNGGTFKTAKVRAAAGDGESIFVNVIAFDDAAKSALLALGDGDSVALAGTLTPKVWTDKHGDARPARDMVAHAVLTTYHMRRKRAAGRGNGAGRSAAQGATGATANPFQGGDNPAKKGIP